MKQLKNKDSSVIKSEISNKKSDDYNLLTEKPEKLKTGSYEEVADFIKDNEYIKNGYLLNCNSIKKSIKSLFVLHNELVNIWSHLLGALFFIILIFYTIFFITNYRAQLKIVKTDISQTVKNLDSLSNDEKYSFKPLIDSVNELNFNFSNNSPQNIYINSFKKLNSIYDELKSESSQVIKSLKISITQFTSKIYSLIDELRDLINLDSKYINNEHNIQTIINNKEKKYLPRWPLFIMIISAILCLTFSSTFHALGGISPKFYTILSRFDYGGISLLITGSCFPPYYFFFYYSNTMKYLYLSFISIFGISTFCYSLTNDFNSPKRRTLRGILFIIFGLCAGIPVIHMALFGNYIKGYVKGVKLLFWYIGGVSYVTGALFYIMRFPEKKLPGKFDYFGASHQIFHVLVFVGAFTHFLGSLDAYYYRFDNLGF